MENFDVNLLNEKGLEIYKHAEALYNYRGNEIVSSALINDFSNKFKKIDLELILLAKKDLDNFKIAIMSKKRLLKTKAEVELEKQRQMELEREELCNNFKRYLSANYRKNLKHLIVNYLDEDLFEVKIKLTLGKKFASEYLKLDLDNFDYDTLLIPNGFLEVYGKYRFKNKILKVINNSDISKYKEYMPNISLSELYLENDRFTYDLCMNVKDVCSNHSYDSFIRRLSDLVFALKCYIL